MNIKVTVIGSNPGSGFAATRIGGDDTRAGFKPTAMPGTPAAAPTPPAPTPAPVAPTAFKPTAMRAPQASPAPVEAPKATTFAPTALPIRSADPLPIREPAPAPAPATPIKLSTLPGVQRKPMDVAMDDMLRRFPQTSPEALQRARGVLSGVHLSTMSSGSWVLFGKEVQEELSGLVKQRLAYAQEPAVRSAPQHLSRLHALLSEVLDAFAGGFFKSSPEKVWADSKAEVESLERLLTSAGSALGIQLSKLEDSKHPAATCGERLEATALAAEYLLDEVPADIGGLLVARVTSLTGSEAMLKDHLAFLEQDITTLQELMTLVQDGVLLKLPAVYTQLAGLAGKPTETQRFLATEKLSDVLLTIKNGKNP